MFTLTQFQNPSNVNNNILSFFKEIKEINKNINYPCINSTSNTINPFSLNNNSSNHYFSSNNDSLDCNNNNNVDNKNILFRNEYQNNVNNESNIFINCISNMNIFSKENNILFQKSNLNDKIINKGINNNSQLNLFYSSNNNQNPFLVKTINKNNNQNANNYLDNQLNIPLTKIINNIEGVSNLDKISFSQNTNDINNGQNNVRLNCNFSSSNNIINQNSNIENNQNNNLNNLLNNLSNNNYNINSINNINKKNNNYNPNLLPDNLNNQNNNPELININHNLNSNINDYSKNNDCSLNDYNVLNSQIKSSQNNYNQVTNNKINQNLNIEKKNENQFSNLIHENFDSPSNDFIKSYVNCFGHYPNMINNEIVSYFNSNNLLKNKGNSKQKSKSQILFTKEKKEKNYENENINLCDQNLKSNQIKSEINDDNNIHSDFFKFSNFKQFQNNKNRNFKIKKLKDDFSDSSFSPNKTLPNNYCEKKGLSLLYNTLNVFKDVKTKQKIDDLKILKLEMLKNQNNKEENSPEKLRKEFNENNFNSHIPICTKYKLNPRIEQLCATRQKDLKSVNNFSISSNNMTITFKNPVNLLNVNLDKLIINSNFSLSIEKNDKEIQKIFGPVIIEIFIEESKDNILKSILSNFKSDELNYNSKDKILKFETDLKKILS